MITTTQPGWPSDPHSQVLTDKKIELYNITQKVKDFVKSLRSVKVCC